MISRWRWILAFVLSLTLILVPWMSLPGGTLIACELRSQVEGDRRHLDIEFPRPCLDQKLHLDRFLDQARQDINNDEFFPFTIRRMRYQLVDNGFRILGNLAIEYPVIGLVNFELSQTVFVNLNQGSLNVEAGETRVQVNVPFIRSNDLSPLLNQMVNTQLRIFNQKRLQDFLQDTELDQRMAQETGLTVEVINFLVQSIQDHFSAQITKDSVIVSIDVENGNGNNPDDSPSPATIQSLARLYQIP
ncbi:hypothetical protein [Sodalinema gerasimenkoae]|uniref:hypothetical protein n=1 Tax=Sodalinema gerasimenkoae TaxID=2862348 RepID=UPI00135BCA8F|nr:hypothetical protein [Sodalinema gerasimenkoae]